MAHDDASYELVFSPEGGREDLVVVHPTGAVGPGGNPVYRDDSGIIQVEINKNCEARVLATGALQRPRRLVGCRRVSR
jgi:hypothetical protein